MVRPQADTYCQWSEKHHAHLAEAGGSATITLDGLGNTIDDAEFFPDLPGLVHGVADRLTRLMDLDKRLISALHKACTACPHAPCPLLPSCKLFHRQRWWQHAPSCLDLQQLCYMVLAFCLHVSLC